MTLERIDAAIDAVCRELVATPHNGDGWRELGEHVIFREIVASILGSRVSFEMALVATRRLAEEGLLERPGAGLLYLRRVEAILSEPMLHPDWNRCRRYRFPKTRSKALASTATSFYSDGGSIKTWLSTFGDSRSARRGLIKKASGVGPKQASMILRNIRFCYDVAVLDSHLLRFMKLRGICHTEPHQISTLAGYEEAERRFLSFADRTLWPITVLDQAIWLVMRVYPGTAT